uniref:cytochrome b561 domain-containing protein n=1 Tax=Pararhizobium sp. IMCC3301 TaxID=3067904 RepID=UPI002741F880|nr:cytochrome b561 domain-containing protein [Pararhizobium sp. IMCC3301]
MAFGLIEIPLLPEVRETFAGTSWLLESLDPDRPHQLSQSVSWHGRLMVLAWSVLFPAGIIAARFFKITPRQTWPDELDNKTWWYLHLTLQYLGGTAMLAGFLMIWLGSGGNPAAPYHRMFGYGVITFGLLQFVAGWLRGTKGGPTDPGPDGSISGDHYDMTPRRRIFETCHKLVGYGVLLVASATLWSGLLTVNAPNWMWGVLAVWWSVLIAVFVILQRRGYAVETYQAIWGPREGRNITR